jgi:hypothetical protein
VVSAKSLTVPVDVVVWTIGPLIVAPPTDSAFVKMPDHSLPIAPSARVLFASGSRSCAMPVRSPFSMRDDLVLRVVDVRREDRSTRPVDFCRKALRA